jgi:glyoxylase-like metal-dependent hydrolase (beta-lactamase superfamily II)
MKTTQLSKGVCQLTFLKFSNCYLVREEDDFTLIDTSLSGHADEIMATARSLGGQVSRILLTHAHGDHIGSLDALHHLCGSVNVAISEREAPLLHKDLSLRPGEPQQKPGGSFPGAKTRPTHTLSEGELYGSLRCFYTSGHTPGHMSFLDERDNTLYAGDVLTSIGGLHVVTDPPWYFPLPAMATWDKPLALQSARKLAALRPNRIATGHGRFIPDGTNALNAALAHAEAAS